ncbi:hypothetical protein A6770_24730 [Nostoc minutum NIES-26]|uniref:Uncharacterized protein n=1 Tax=Nostoc minutum NIES-26 TaxID=1844469 RepID=A0A367QVJ0_9NOSO|nr:hypothetical protein A6770_24730 [Nostoc minutum NIES-26]
MIAVTDIIEQNSLRQELTNRLLKTSFDVFETNFDVLDETEIDYLETIMTTEFKQGMPNDTEIAFF